MAHSTRLRRILVSGTALTALVSLAGGASAQTVPQPQDTKEAATPLMLVLALLAASILVQLLPLLVLRKTPTPGAVA